MQITCGVSKSHWLRTRVGFPVADSWQRVYQTCTHQILFPAVATHRGLSVNQTNKHILSIRSTTAKICMWNSPFSADWLDRSLAGKVYCGIGRDFFGGAASAAWRDDDWDKDSIDRDSYD